MAEKSRKIGLVESILMHLQITPIDYVKYRNEEREYKTLRGLIKKEGVVEVTAIDEGGV